MSDLTANPGDGFARFDRYAAEQAVAAGVPGMAIALFDREHCLHLLYYGFASLESRIPVQAATLFQIGSITKSFTALAVVQAAEAGLLDLYAPVTDYLPWFEVQSRYAPGGAITIHHLLTHTAGLVEIIDKSPGVAGAVWALRETEVAWAPGAQFSYSDAGYQLLTLVLEKVWRQPYADIIKAGIFDPLEMDASVATITHAIRPQMAKGYQHLYDDRPPYAGQPLVEAPWIETNSGDCCIVSTAEDMAKYGRMLLNGGKGPGGELLSEESFRQLMERAVGTEWGEYGYGLMIHRREGSTFIGHGGGMPGFTAQLLLNVDEGLGLAMLSAHRYPPNLHWRIMNSWKKAGNGEAEMADSFYSQPKPPALTENAEDYAGTYRSVTGEGALILRAEEGRLVLDYGGDEIVLEERGEKSFYVGHPDFRLFLLKFGCAESKDGASSDRCDIVEAWYGADLYVKDLYKGTKEYDYPEEWKAYSGHYRSHNPWQTNFRVVLRKGRLWLVWPDGEEAVLVPLEDGAFRVGDELTPEKIRFCDIVDGQALRASLPTCDYYRFFTL